MANEDNIVDVRYPLVQGVTKDGTPVKMRVNEEGELVSIEGSGYQAFNPETEEIQAVTGRGEIRGLSTDTKPQDVPLYTFFLEIDTGNLYYYNHEGEWVLFD